MERNLRLQVRTEYIPVVYMPMSQLLLRLHEDRFLVNEKGEIVVGLQTDWNVSFPIFEAKILS